MFKDLPIFDALKTRMRWQQERHSILSENVANSDTPGYQSKDLKELSFNRFMASAGTRPHAFSASGSKTYAAQAGSMMRTNEKHLGTGSGLGGNGFQAEQTSGFETTYSGNSVNLEEQMTAVATNQIDFQTATTLYTKSLSLLRTAVSRR